MIRHMDPRIARPAEHHGISLPGILSLHSPSHHSPTQTSQTPAQPPQPPHPAHPPLAHHHQSQRLPQSPAHLYQYPPSYAPPTTHQPPLIRPEWSPGHGHSREGSGQATPVNRQPPQHPPFQPQRTTSPPPQPISSAPMRQPHERSSEGLPHHQQLPAYHQEAHQSQIFPQGFYGNQQLSPHLSHPQAESGAPPPHHPIDQGPATMQPPAYTVQVPPGYAVTQQQARRRQGNRAAQACESCRTRKSKCDGNQPCAYCTEHETKCVFRESNSSKEDKSGPPLLNTINTATEALLEKVNRIEEMIKAQAASREASREIEHEDAPRNDTPAAETMIKTVQSTPQPSDRRQSSQHQAQQTSFTTVIPEAQEGDSASDFDEHTTAAHKLLYLWPSINSLFDPTESQGLRANYMMEGEARGWLRLDGAGEAPKADGMGSYDADSDTEGASPPNLWEGATYLPADPVRGKSSNESTKLDLREGTIRKLVDLYSTNIHILHPFLDMPTLTKFLPTFIKRHASTAPKTTVPLPFTSNNGEGAQQSNKRKRDHSAPFNNAENYSSATPQPPRVEHERSLPVAIIYLVLALGKICEHQGLIPGPQMECGTHGSMPPPSLPYTGSPPVTFKPSPASTVTSFNEPTPSSADYRGLAHSPQSTYDSPYTGTPKRRRNVDVIPGLGYYREACQILGLFADSTDLAVAQARLLAGLYKGQLGRVQESWRWIYDATVVCRYQLRINKLDHAENIYERKHPPGSKKDIFENTLLLVCWSALQLESDIVAELDYPHSGLANLQSFMPFPNTARGGNGLAGHRIESDSQRAIEFYNLQLWLRKRLNEMHAELYGRKLVTLKAHKLAEDLTTGLDMLNSWREIHPWDDDEPPAADILEVRIRGKFYGALYVQTRPYVDYVLHAMSAIDQGRSPAEMAHDAYGRIRPNESYIFAAIATESRQTIIERARMCVMAAIRSTTAFDGVGGRLIVTNIIGTSHAQFSNMLVLAAVNQSGIDFLAELIPDGKMMQLMRRTIRFLAQLRLCSPTPNKDILYLQMIHQRLFPNEPVPSPDGWPGGFMSAVNSFASDM